MGADLIKSLSWNYNKKYIKNQDIEKYKNAYEHDCAICLESITHQTECVLSCKHRFHRKCIILVKEMICPMCRKIIDPDDFKTIDIKAENKQYYYDLLIDIGKNLLKYHITKSSAV